MNDYKDRIVFDEEVVNTLEYLQHNETLLYYTALLDDCVEAAIDKPDLFEDDERAFDIVRGLHTLRKILRSLCPGYGSQG